jgi:hypothetical protein
MKTLSCAECRSIAREMAEAYAEAWHSGGDRFRTVLAARNGLFGGTEEDVVRAEEAFAQAPSVGSAGIRDAIRKWYLHVARTGHRWPERGREE